MTLIRGGPAGPHTEDAIGYQNLVEDDRAALWRALGARQGIISGFDHSLPSGVLGHDFTAGAALLEERDASGNLGSGRGYHLYEDVAFQVLHDTPDAGSRNDALVFAYVDIEDGVIGAGVSQSGPQVVVVKGTSGVTTPHADSAITTALGRGGWVRYADVIIDPADTEVNPANVTFDLGADATRGLLNVSRGSDQTIFSAAPTLVVFNTEDERIGRVLTLEAGGGIQYRGAVPVRASIAAGIQMATDNMTPGTTGMNLVVRRQASAIARDERLATTGSTGTSCSCPVIVLQPGDLIEAEMGISNAAGNGIAQSAPGTYMSVALLD